MMKRWLVAMSAMAQFACDCCIARGAKVKTPRGEVNVEDVAVGDEVTVVDPETLEQHVGCVTHVRTAKRECGRIDQLRLTSSHPLYDPEKHEWAPAGDWLLGVRSVLQTTAGPTRVERAERFVGVDDVYDLTVDHPLHTFVADGVVVHNKPPIMTTCVDTAGVTVRELDPCTCPAGLTGRISCPFGGVGTCSCPASDWFTSNWVLRGAHLDAVTDEGRWSLEACDAGAGLVVVAQPEQIVIGNALSVPVDACGRVTRSVDVGALPSGSVRVRVSGSVTAPTPLLMVNDLVICGLVPDADGGVRFFTGSVDSPAVAFESLPEDTWHQVEWELDFAAHARVFPRISGNGASLNATEFWAPDGQTTLADWYAADGGFEVTVEPTRVRLGVTEPSEVELHFAGFELKPR